MSYKKNILAGIILVISCHNSISQTKFENIPHTLAFENITVKGEMKMRALANFDRLERDKYLPQNLFITEAESGGWPGDTEGRTILALTLLSQATHRTPNYLSEIMQIFPTKLNAQGYFGTIYGDTISEQQLSSHGWVLRALSEYYLWKKDANTLQMINRIIANLALPTKGLHAIYPIDPSKRIHTGSYAGTHQKSIGKWILSTDIGCNFIFLDGLVQAYQLNKTPELEALIEEMIDRFLQMDLIAIKAQTHATLTVLRVMLRYYEINGNEKHLLEAQKRFELYLREGMTENYENYNWFGRPEWTETCAVIDSYMVAFALWRFTAKAEYLDYAQRIYYNGMCMEQRYDGSFGSQNCAGAKDDLLNVKITDVHWCCTMRGGEGLARAVENLIYVDKHSIYFPFFASAEVKIPYESGEIVLEEITDFPYKSSVKIVVKKNTLNFIPELKLFVPSYATKIILRINNKIIKTDILNNFVQLKASLKEGDVISYKFETKVQNSPTINRNTMPGHQVFMFGPLLLSSKQVAVDTLTGKEKFKEQGKLVFKSKKSKIVLQPVMHLMDSTVTKESKYNRKVLFK
jgi:hypothetical protein